MKPSFITDLFSHLREFPRVLDVAFSKDNLGSKMMKLGAYNKESFHNNFENLKKRGFINKKGLKYYFTLKARSWFEKKKFKRLSLENNKPDGYWRIVVFDIPEPMRKSRDNFRRKLESLGFYLFQKSTFVAPFSCDKELDFIIDFFGLEEYVDVLIARSIGRRGREIRKIFGL